MQTTFRLLKLLVATHNRKVQAELDATIDAIHATHVRSPPHARRERRRERRKPGRPPARSGSSQRSRHGPARGFGRLDCTRRGRQSCSAADA